MVRQVEHDGRHAFRVMDELGAECDRCGIKAVDARGKTMPASDFLNQIIEYVLAREADRERLRLTDGEREAIADAAAAYEYDDQDKECARIALTLRGLLERTPPTHPTPGDCSLRRECIPPVPSPESKAPEPAGVTNADRMPLVEGGADSPVAAGSGALLPVHPAFDTPATVRA